MRSEPSAEEEPRVHVPASSGQLPPEDDVVIASPVPAAEGQSPEDAAPDAGATDELLLSAARRNEWVLFSMAVAVLAASFFLQPAADGHLRLPFCSLELPGVCWWKQTTGMDCPGCGLSRCFVSLAHGDVAAATEYHPFGVLLFLAAAAQIPYRAYKIRRLARGQRPWSHPVLTAVLWFCVIGLFAQWLLKLAGVMPLSPGG